MIIVDNYYSINPICIYITRYFTQEHLIQIKIKDKIENNICTGGQIYILGEKQDYNTFIKDLIKSKEIK